MTKLNLLDFVYLGADQGRVAKHPMVRAFYLIVGPLGVHARIRNARLLNTILSFHRNLNGWRVLDVGAGYGYSLHWLARRFPQANLDGYELNPDQSEACREVVRKNGLKNLHFHTGSSADLPEAAYDLAISIDVLEHVQDDLGMLKAFRRALKPGGFLFVHVPLRHQAQKRIFTQFRKHTVHDHVRDEYLPEEIQRVVSEAGFLTLRIGYGFGFWGELAFELNNLFWGNRILRNLSALALLPFCLLTGYFDSIAELKQGNSIVLVARKPLFAAAASQADSQPAGVQHG